MRRLRYALCELLGGHRSVVNASYMSPAGKPRTLLALRLQCTRCGKMTRWISLREETKRIQTLPEATE